jgi:hypothetical protein
VQIVVSRILFQSNSEVDIDVTNLVHFETTSWALVE